IAGFDFDAAEQIVTWGQGPIETLSDFPTSIRVTQLADPAKPARELLSRSQVIGCQLLASGQLLAWCDNGKLLRYSKSEEPEEFDTVAGLFRLTLSPDQRHALALS